MSLSINNITDEITNELVAFIDQFDLREANWDFTGIAVNPNRIESIKHVRALRQIPHDEAAAKTFLETRGYCVTREASTFIGLKEAKDFCDLVRLLHAAGPYYVEILSKRIKPVEKRLCIRCDCTLREEEHTLCNWCKEQEK